MATVSLEEIIEEFICETLVGGAGEDYDIFMVEEIRDMFIELLVRNKDLISTTLYNESPRQVRN
tara:strand:- start:166 stop:357 length:192 start_codon:yes stop_codon:yes gene_type:complete